MRHVYKKYMYISTDKYLNKYYASFPQISPEYSRIRYTRSQLLQSNNHLNLSNKYFSMPPSIIPRNLYRFGSASQVAPVRFDYDIKQDSSGHVQPGAGISTFVILPAIELANVWYLPKDTVLPDGLQVINDYGQHHVLSPDKVMSARAYQELVRGLPFQRLPKTLPNNEVKLFIDLTMQNTIVAQALLAVDYFYDRDDINMAHHANDNAFARVLADAVITKQATYNTLSSNSKSAVLLKRSLLSLASYYEYNSEIKYDMNNEESTKDAAYLTMDAGRLNSMASGVVL